MSQPEDMPDRARKGRGAVSNRGSRFLAQTRHLVDDGWGSAEEEWEQAPQTEITYDTARSAITYNKSPDLPFDRSLNPYKGCEHGCVYCFARPGHAWLGLSPGLDFETKLSVKPNIAQSLIDDLRAKTYKPAPIALGTATDPYQPIEREFGLTRQALEVLAAANHPVAITTKSPLVTRDIDILRDMAKKGLARVAMSVTTLDRTLARHLEPRAATPDKRLAAIAELTEAGIPTNISFSPVIPALTDNEIETVLKAGREAGATSASMLLIRLPLEIKDLFREWLDQHYPDRADRVESLIRQCRDGKLYQADFGTRFKGTGAYADLINQRFKLTKQRLGFEKREWVFDLSLFRPPVKAGDQLSFF
ncbi:PA0069 family radical SAM protein [Lacibacterium aquatile]|uniref:PA0069 family radical SAM protein n=1 Tax=Lacibacterium aquatile TaxID=1168082 RepID=A0ABW5DWU8_9PROT